MLCTSCEKEMYETPGNLEFEDSFLDQYFITAIAFQDDGTAWIGTFRQGLIRYRDGGVTLFNEENSPLPDSAWIHDIEIDSRENIWIACGKIVCFNENDFTTIDASHLMLPENNVTSIAIDSRDNVWCASSIFDMGGLVRLNGKEMEVFTPENSDLPGHRIQDVEIDNNDAVWCTMTEIVNNTWIIKITGDSLETYDSADLGFSPYSITDIALNSAGDLIGLIDYSLSSNYYADSENPDVFIFDGESSETFSLDDVYLESALSVDHEDRIWVGGFGRLLFYENGEWKTITRGLYNKSIYAIRFHDNQVWVGTNAGMVVYKTQPGTPE